MDPKNVTPGVPDEHFSDGLSPAAVNACSIFESDLAVRAYIGRLIHDHDYPTASSLLITHSYGRTPVGFSSGGAIAGSIATLPVESWNGSEYESALTLCSLTSNFNQPLVIVLRGLLREKLTDRSWPQWLRTLKHLVAHPSSMVQIETLRAVVEFRYSEVFGDDPRYLQFVDELSVKERSVLIGLTTLFGLETNFDLTVLGENAQEFVHKLCRNLAREDLDQKLVFQLWIQAGRELKNPLRRAALDELWIFLDAEPQPGAHLLIAALSECFPFAEFLPRDSKKLI